MCTCDFSSRVVAVVGWRHEEINYGDGHFLRNNSNKINLRKVP